MTRLERAARSRAVWIAAGSVIAVVLLVAGLLVILPHHSQQSLRPTSASATVREFLRAIAAGNADRARSLVVDQQDSSAPDKSLLSDQALGTQRDAAALAGIRVGNPTAPDGRAASTDLRSVAVHADFTLAGTAMSTVYTVNRGDRGWVIADGLVSLTFAGSTIPGLTLLGVLLRPITPAPSTMVVSVFPGALVWGSSNRYLRVTSEPGYVLGGEQSSRVSLRTELSDSGHRAVATALNRYLARCATSSRAAASEDKSGCVQQLYRSAKPGSVQWTAPRSHADLVTEVAGVDPLTVSVFGSVDWGARYTPTYGGEASTTVAQVMDGVVDLGADPPRYTPTQ